MVLVPRALASSILIFLDVQALAFYTPGLFYILVPERCYPLDFLILGAWALASSNFSLSLCFFIFVLRCWYPSFLYLCVQVLASFFSFMSLVPHAVESTGVLTPCDFAHLHTSHLMC
jgi:hypothetical protein